MQAPLRVRVLKNVCVVHITACSHCWRTLCTMNVSTGGQGLGQLLASSTTSAPSASSGDAGPPRSRSNSGNAPLPDAAADSLFLYPGVLELPLADLRMPLMCVRASWDATGVVDSQAWNMAPLVHVLGDLGVVSFLPHAFPHAFPHAYRPLCLLVCV